MLKCKKKKKNRIIIIITTTTPTTNVQINVFQILKLVIEVCIV